MLEVHCIIPDDMLSRLKEFLGDINLKTKEVRICLIEGCNERYYAKGYCSTHYNKLKNYGDPLYERPTTSSKYEHKEWKRIQDICSNPAHGLYPRYGGRGVTVCDRWLQSFEAFLEDMGAQPSPGSIVDGDSFEPGRCVWKSLSEFQEENEARASRRLRR